MLPMIKLIGNYVHCPPDMDVWRVNGEQKARIYEGHETILFFSIFRNFIVFKGGRTDGYKNFITEKEIPDETYQEDGVTLFRVQGSGPENMQAIHVDPFRNATLPNVTMLQSWIHGLKKRKAALNTIWEENVMRRQPHKQPLRLKPQSYEAVVSERFLNTFMRPVPVLVTDSNAWKREETDGSQPNKVPSLCRVDNSYNSWKGNSTDRTEKGDKKGLNNLQLSTVKQVKRLSCERMLNKGKSAYVRISKRKPSQLTQVGQKLVLDKRGSVRYKDESSTDTDFEEGELLNFGKFRGECSNVKSLGKGCNKTEEVKPDPPNALDGWQASLNPFDLYDSESGPRTEGPKEVSSGPRQITVRNEDKNMVSISDQEGGMVSLPLQSPIQLPLTVFESGQITGKDFVAVPLSVELEGVKKREFPATGYQLKKAKKRGVVPNDKSLINSSSSPRVQLGTKAQDAIVNKMCKQVTKKFSWNLEVKLAKVIEKGTALAMIYKPSTNEMDKGMV
ncbi:hypothetical protein Dsin_014222 [Dipteronia sinensis]|uniref:Uncharacterized protein n=1 Tax=Dipteronia sinensis TaxID=43782 RepID=A0AAE0EA43_9ROSI|nr:hypothetical protein Dsin_014222 [Dipteronia sinensis]